MDITDNDLSARIARLEGRNRALGWCLAASVLGGLTAWSMGLLPGAARAAGYEIVTSRVVLTDTAGGIRATLGVIEGFGPSLVIYGENGKAGAALAMPPEGPMLALYDQAGQLRMRLAAIESTGPSLALNDAKRRPRAQLAIIGDTPGLMLLNDSGQPTWRTP